MKKPTPRAELFTRADFVEHLGNKDPRYTKAWVAGYRRGITPKALAEVARQMAEAEPFGIGAKGVRLRVQARETAATEEANR